MSTVVMGTAATITTMVILPDSMMLRASQRILSAA